MPIFEGTYTITNRKSKTQLDLSEGNKANGTKVLGWQPHPPNDHASYPNQVWKVHYTNKSGVDSYTICNVRTGTYMEVSGGNATDGTQVTCSEASAKEGHTGNEQEWELVKIDNSGYYRLRNVMSQTYLDLDTGSSQNGTKVHGWGGPIDGNENQLWAFHPVSKP